MKNTGLFQTILILISLIGKQNIKPFVLLQLLIIFSSLVEILSLFSILPLIQIILEPDILSEFIATVPVNFIDNISPENLILYFGLGVILLCIVSFSISLLKDWYITLFANQIGFGVGDYLFRNYLMCGMEFHIENNSSFLNKQISIEAIRVKNMLKSLFQLNSNVFMVLMIIVGLIIYQTSITILIATFLLGFYLAVNKFLKPKLERNGRLLSEILRERFKIINNSLSGVVDVILTQSNDHFASKMNKTGILLSKTTTINQVLGLVPGKVAQSILIIVLVSVLVYYSVQPNEYDASLFVTLSAFLLSGLKIMPLSQTIYAAIANIQGNKSALEVITSDISKFPDHLVLNGIKSESSALAGDVTFQNVSYSYPGTTKLIIDNLSAVFKVGSKVGVVGETGSGKSTLSNLYASLISPTKGVIKVGGINLNHSNHELWRKLIAVVSQDVVLIDGSVIENIAFGQDPKKINFDRAIECARRAKILDHINSLPEKMNENIGERGVQLSGGQKQRLAIARALYRDARYLIFDESTSALDANTESKVMDEIMKSETQLTMLIIAHRVHTLAKCDFVFRIDKGKIVEQGTYQELFDLSGKDIDK